MLKICRLIEKRHSDDNYVANWMILDLLRKNFAKILFKEDTYCRMIMAMYVMFSQLIHGLNVALKEESVSLVRDVILSHNVTNKEFALKVRIGKPVTAGTYASVFDFCAGRCRHNSASVVHENAYASDFHHCFSLQPNTSGPVDATIEERLAGINVFVGRQGQSCNSVCKSQGQSCVVNKLLALNTCEMMQRYMSCKGACVASRGVDQPAEVADNAPKHMVYYYSFPFP
ncbi:hypothetical protein AMTR_s00049p00052020 [Amborella trichopoda]|uniref:SREBP regulating gene protein n=1 Tax=Amborella trichopoda TaxID=13333 RepID=W1Q0Q4_AMBTC|nr:hypothetical protein AMTR_s00049p00052020 [Amborella trichopoda]